MMHSATQAGRSWSLTSTEYSSTNSMLPLTSSTETRVQFALIELPEITGPGKRNLLIP